MLVKLPKNSKTKLLLIFIYLIALKYKKVKPTHLNTVLWSPQPLKEIGENQTGYYYLENSSVVPFLFGIKYYAELYKNK